ncbi:hypothetical protein BC826DRAFT_484543 [Russula brevipes]|nr:hypothetical protein BC826DRAFT_484543 [Russula brevipes]
MTALPFHFPVYGPLKKSHAPASIAEVMSNPVRTSRGAPKANPQKYPGTPRLAITPERLHQIFERDPTAWARCVVWEDPHGRGGSADEATRAARGFCPTVRDRTEAWQVRACLPTKVRRRTPVVMSLQCLRFAELKA